MLTVAAQYQQHMGARDDTSYALELHPFYGGPSVDDMLSRGGCHLGGVELSYDSVDLPSFRHPSQCAYVLGPERGSLSPEMVEKCEFVVKIPTSFCINVSVAAALVLYDRSLSMGRFAERPVRAGGPVKPVQEHQHGGPVIRQMEKFRQEPPLGEGFDPEGFSA